MSERRVSLVTGASQGIGRELAIAFAGQGDAVVLAARNTEGLEATARAVTAAGGEPLVAPTDVSDPAAVETTSRLVLDHFGRVDVSGQQQRRGWTVGEDVGTRPGTSGWKRLPSTSSACFWSAGRSCLE